MLTNPEPNRGPVGSWLLDIPRTAPEHVVVDGRYAPPVLLGP